jgi:hypothetical protein
MCYSQPRLLTIVKANYLQVLSLRLIHMLWALLAAPYMAEVENPEELSNTRIFPKGLYSIFLLFLLCASPAR